MADLQKKIMDLDTGTPVDTDWIPFVDISDTTQSAEGSTKRALKSELQGAIGNGIASIVLVSTVGLVKTYRITYTDATTFDYVVTDGTNGTNGESFTWLGAYSGATAYIPNDAVSYNGSSYMCILSSTGNLPTDGTYWDLMALKGTDGAGSGDVTKVGTPVNNQVAVWTGDGTIEGDSDLTFDGTKLQTPLVGVGMTNTGNAYIEAKTLTAGGVQGFRVEADNVGNIQFSSFLTGDTQLRFSYLADGTHKWGDGTSVPDTNLYRSAADILKTDDSLHIGGSLGATGTRVVKGWFTDIESTNAPTVGGVNVPTISSTSTITNKRNQPRIVSAASYTTDTGTSLDFSTCDIFIVTAQAGALKFNNPSGTPQNGEKIIIRVKDNGTARALTYDTQYRAIGVTLPTTTVINKTLYMGGIWNATDTKLDIVAYGIEA